MEEEKQKNMEGKEEEEKEMKTLVLFSTTAQSFVLVLLHVSATYFSHHQGTIML